MLSRQERTMPGRAIISAARGEGAQHIGRCACAALMAFLCARASLFGGVQTAGAALFAAGLCGGYGGLSMIIGCIAGCALTGGVSRIWPAFACLSVWLIMCVMRSMEYIQIKSEKTARMFRRILSAAQGDTDSARFVALAACAAGVSNLIMTAALAGSSNEGLVYCGISALMGFGLTPVFALALNGSDAPVLHRRCALMLLCATCASGLSGILAGMLDLHALACAAALAVLTYDLPGEAGKRAASGFALGCVLSACLLAADDLSWRLAVYPIAGTLAGLMGSAAYGLPGAVVCALCGLMDGYGTLTSGAIGAVGAALCGAINRINGDERQRRDAQNLLTSFISRECAQVQQRLVNLERDVDDITQSAPPMSRARELGEMRRLICSGCAREGRCWNRADSAGYAALIRLRDAIMRGEAVSATILPTGCARSAELETRLPAIKRLFSMDECKRAIAKRREDILSDERIRIRGEAEAEMRSLRRLKLDANASHRASRALRAAKLSSGRVCVTAGEERLAFVEGGANPEGIERELMRTTGVDFEVTGKSGNVFRLRQRSRLSVHGAVRRYAQSADACGDSALITRLSDGRWLAAVSDGKGRGDAAARESCAALAVVNRLLGDGVRPESALEIANTILQLRGDDEMYATLDVMLIDPESGRADSYKLGAAPSVLVSGGRARMITGSALPCGILADVSAAHRLARLRDGDRLIMLTDGVCDFSDDDQRRSLMSLSCALLSDSPDSAAERLIARMRAKYSLKDDAAVVVIDISARRHTAHRHFFGLHSRK